MTRGQFARFVEVTRYLTDAESDGKCGFSQDDTHPVVNVSWNDAVAFCSWLSRKENAKYRLPTEVEWEYSCRAGSTSHFHFGNNVEEMPLFANYNAWTASTVGRRSWEIGPQQLMDGHVFTAPVASFQANPWGLYDMHGNAWEWCASSTEYPKASPSKKGGTNRETSVHVYRGGSWYNCAPKCRSALREGGQATDRKCDLGFRVVREMK